MKKGIKWGGMALVLAGVLSVAGMAGGHGSASAATHPRAQQPSSILAHSCVGAEIVTTNGTACFLAGTHEYVTGVTRICNTNQYPVNFVGSSTIYVIYPGECQTLASDSGTIYVDS